MWAIAEGRACAAGVDRYLMGETTLPAPVLPTTGRSCDRPPSGQRADIDAGGGGDAVALCLAPYAGGMRSLLRPLGVIAFGLSPAILITACGDDDDETANTPVVAIQETSYVVKEPATTTTTIAPDVIGRGRHLPGRAAVHGRRR